MTRELSTWCVFMALLFAHKATAQTLPSGPATRPAPPQLTVAVLDFAGSVPGSPELGAQVGEAVTALLSGQESFTLVDRAIISRTLQEQELSLSGLAKPEDAVRVGNLVGAKILIIGKVFTLDNTVFLTAKVIGTETSLVEGVLVKGKAEAGVADLFTQLSEKIADKIKASGGRLVAAPDLLDPIPSMKQKLADKPLPRAKVSVREEHRGEAPKPIDPAVETELRIVLQKIGFPQVDSATAGKDDYDVTIDGEAFSEFAGRIGNLVTCTARAEIKVIDRKTGKLIYSDRATTRAADLSENIAGKTALQKAGHELGLRWIQFLIDSSSTSTTQPAKH